ncbi:MAG: phosphoribosylamine/glycine ligase [Thermoleophilia bacterium]|nr:phosphoribosylamine/glycine ligase [Thermoleophilia bacterium]MCZ4495898.1 phosphoribosylamine/glycine ligase [Thermoleophilia bacterium]
MKVLVVGSGAREHALCWKLGQSPLLTELHAVPGNVGMVDLATIHPKVAERDIDGITTLAEQLGVDLVIVGPEGPLVDGLSNRLKKHGIACCGPSAAGARVEGSKVFAKELMDRAQVPTARWEAFSDVQAALAAINRWRGPVVIKADGITGGRGAFVCMTKVAAEKALHALLVNSEFGVAGRRIVVEEFLQGIEASITVLTDGESVLPLHVVRSEKRRDEGDTGPNTDGMGAWLPVEELYEQQIEEAIEAGIKPALEDYRERGMNYVGVLYADVMFTKTGPKVLEYNCRFGDLELQSMVRSMDEDLLDLLHRTATGTLGEFGTELAEASQATTAIAIIDSAYPRVESLDTVTAIAGLADAAELEGVEVFLGSVATTGTGKSKGPGAAGGRVLTVTAVADTVEASTALAHEAAALITFEGSFHRTDIAANAGIFA